MKKLLLLGGSRYLLPVIKAARSLGVYTITCDYLPDNIAHKYSDEYLNISIVDKDAVLEGARALNIDGVMSFACDPGVVTAAYVAQKLGLPSCGTYEATCILQDKGKFRKFLTHNGFTVPKAKSYSDSESAVADAAMFSWPVIVKPVDSAGSKGVRRVDDLRMLPDAIENAVASSLNGRFIIEDFIEQKGYASDTECFSVDGVLRFASFNCQHFDPKAENPYTPAGFTWPASMSAAHQTELRDELQRLMSLLKLGTGVYNVEARESVDGKVYIMEVSPRGGGNRLCEMLRYACGTDLILNAVKAAVGLPVDELSDPVYNGFWAEVILHSPADGIFKELWVDDAVAPFVVERDLWVEPGDRVERFTGANKSIGTLVLRFDSEREREARMTDKNAWERVIVEE